MVCFFSMNVTISILTKNIQTSKKVQRSVCVRLRLADSPDGGVVQNGYSSAEEGAGRSMVQHAAHGQCICQDM